MKQNQVAFLCSLSVIACINVTYDASFSVFYLNISKILYSSQSLYTYFIIILASSNFSQFIL